MAVHTNIDIPHGVLNNGIKLDLNEYSNEIKIFLYLANIFDFNEKEPIQVFTDIYTNKIEHYKKYEKNINIYNTTGEVAISSITIIPSVKDEKVIECYMGGNLIFQASEDDLFTVLNDYTERIKYINENHEESNMQPHIDDGIIFLTDRNYKFYYKKDPKKSLSDPINNMSNGGRKKKRHTKRRKSTIKRPTKKMRKKRRTKRRR